MTLWEQEVARLTALNPKFQVRDLNDSWFFRTFNVDAAGITVWNTIYMTKRYLFTDLGAEALRHESVHMMDQHRWNVLFFLSYFLFLPIGPSFKAFWEWRGFRENLRWVREHTPAGTYRNMLEEARVKWIADSFCGKMYLWMWPFRSTVEGWCRKFLERLPK
jgi:hypothetical protein